MSGYATGWDAVVDGLLAAGHEVAFGLPADDLELDRAARAAGLRFVHTRDQRNAVFMATGHALVSGRAGICAVGKGPALANAVSGLVEPYAARVPLLLLATGTAGAARGTGAFQELDQVALAGPLVKWAHRVEAAEQVCESTARALRVAASGVPGPVYLELPEQLGSGPVPRGAPWPGPPPAPPAPPSAEALPLLRTSRRPLILAGGGLRGRGGQVLDLAERLGAGVFVTASGRGAVAEEHPLFCGAAGFYLNPVHRDLWADCDLLLALGTRLEETAVHGLPVPPATVQVNLSELDLSCRFPGLALLGDAGRAVRDWVERLTPAPGAAEWGSRIRAATSAAARLAAERLETGRLSPGPRVAEVLEALAATVPAETVLVQENGLQDMWSYHHPHWVVRRPGGSVVPSEQTSLGFGAAAAIGARLAGRPVAAFVGDGAFDMLGADLGIAVRERVAVLWVVLDNGGYGWLEHQARSQGRRDSAFAAPPVPPSDGTGTSWSTTDGLWTVHERAGLKPSLEAAWARVSAGDPAVVRVPVRLDDLPPGLDDLAGDF